MIGSFQSRPAALIAVIAVAGATAGLSGCTFGGEGGPPQGNAATTAAAKKLTINRPYTGTSTALPGGTFTPSPDNNSVAVQDRPFNGTLSASLGKKIEVQTGSDPDKTFKLKRLSGSFYATVDGTTLPNGSGQWTGIQLIEFDRRKLGLACVGFNSTSANNDRSETGTFAVIGGTKASKRIRFAGSFSQAADNPGQNTSPVSGVITGTIKFNRKKQTLTDECRALKPLLP